MLLAMQAGLRLLELIGLRQGDIYLGRGVTSDPYGIAKEIRARGIKKGFVVVSAVCGSSMRAVS